MATMIELIEALEDLRDASTQWLDGTISRARFEEALVDAANTIAAAESHQEHVYQVANALLGNQDGTWDLTGVPVSYDSGYEVGGLLPGRQWTDGDRVDGVTRWVSGALSRHAGDPDVHFGRWTDEDGTVYLDLCDRTTNRTVAILRGRIRKERAVWDWQNRKAITLLNTETHDGE